MTLVPMTQTLAFMISKYGTWAMMYIDVKLTVIAEAQFSEGKKSLFKVVNLI